MWALHPDVRLVRLPEFIQVPCKVLSPFKMNGAIHTRHPGLNLLTPAWAAVSMWGIHLQRTTSSAARCLLVSGVGKGKEALIHS